MADSFKKEEVLVLVKAYPSLSRKYGEVVCTAGITRDGKWIRLYPIPYRDLPKDQRYGKFQWIKVNVKPAKEKLDRRESHKVDASSVELLEKLSPGSGWKNREKILTPMISKSLEAIQDDGASLGMFEPAEVSDFIVNKGNPEWEKKKTDIAGQTSLFNPRRAPLEKIPYEFRYSFRCRDDRCTGHNQLIIDWEINEGYRKWKNIYKDEKTTLKKMREKWLDYFFRQRQSYLVVGTDSAFGNFMVLTVISPRRREQREIQAAKLNL